MREIHPPWPRAAQKARASDEARGREGRGGNAGGAVFHGDRGSGQLIKVEYGQGR
ncbi:hypothetical protein ACFV6F_06955 [Kitasatospora phosalacinea]|uniref:hypothetical protein n=1 Tax=Kitasatospora phosalacinea TaxID=2065 RepID=UPI003659901C